MADFAMFQGGLVAMKNVGYDASVHLTIAIPQEFGQAVVAAFGWPTNKNPIPVAVARLEGAALTIASARLEKDGEQVKHRRFDELSPAEQAGILCKDPDFKEFLEASRPYSGGPRFSESWTPADMVRDTCGVESRSEIKDDAESGRQWRIILRRFQAWQAERYRDDPEF